MTFFLLRLAPAATLLLLIGPVAVGLTWTVLPAFGYLPAIGGHEFSLQGWRDLFDHPGFGTALRLTVTVGFGATFLSFILASGFCALASERAWLRRFDGALAPLLGSPHAALALGFAFLVAPSGWAVRLVSPELTGWTRPPIDFTAPQDQFGLWFMLGLLLKETPYLILMMIGASGQIRVREALAVSRAMGHRGPAAWMKVVLPQLYPQIRLPVYAVLAFSLSTVEVALILAPGNPPPLAALAARWFSDYDLRLYFPAAAAATLQFLIVAAGIAAWRVGETIVAVAARLWTERGSRGHISSALTWTAGLGTILTGALGLLSLTGMIVWSFAVSWRFPDASPDRVSLATWTAQSESIGAAFQATLTIGLTCAFVSLVLVLACLENEQRFGTKPGRKALWLLYIPLLVPQIAFLFGAQTILVRLSLDGALIAVIWTHLVFVLPYMFLSLSDSYRSLDPRYAASATALGASPMRVFFSIKLPMLLRPIFISFAVGFAVSVGQYLPTVFAGAGRIATLTTDAVTLSGGSDRRIIGVYAALQAALPLIVYALALAIPRALHRNRRGLNA